MKEEGKGRRKGRREEGEGGEEKERRQGRKDVGKGGEGKKGAATSVFYSHKSVLVVIVGSVSGYGAEWLAIAIEHLWMEGVLEGKQGAGSPCGYLTKIHRPKGMLQFCTRDTKTYVG